MFSSITRRTVALAAAGFTAAALGACSPPDDSDDTADTGADEGEATGGAEVDAATATSAADFGGLEGLIEAAQAEGQLNVIALPPDWANYGALISGFEEKYGITVVSDQPNASSAEEISTAQRLQGQSTAPDVFDLGAAVALANTSMFAPYQVETWDTIPDHFKDPEGRWVNDYGGYMSIGYDSSRMPEITSVDDLLGEEFRGLVALNGNPTEAGAAFAGVQMVSLARGGTVGDLAAGVDFFAELHEAGNFLPVDPTPATVESGQTPLVIDWDYLNATFTEQIPTWTVYVPDEAVVAGYYYQAINADAPHPAAARLWQEYLYSDEGQNLWLNGGARPVRMDAMAEAGTIDQAAADRLPEVSGEVIVPTPEDAETGGAFLAENWANAVS